MKPDRKELNQEKLEQISGGGVDITHVFSREPNTCTHPHAVKTPWQCEDGARGQYIIVLPERNAVIAITSDVEDLQGELNLVWERILPIL